MTLWVWDPEKAASNLVKHKVSFEMAAHALGDPLLIVGADPHPDGDRWRGLCSPSPNGSPVLVVIHTEPDLSHAEPIGRIISARRAEPHERRAYEEGES